MSALEVAHRHVPVDSVPGIVLDSMLVPSNESDAPLMRSREPSVSLLDALEADLLRLVRRRRARRVCDSGGDVQSVRTRCRFHVLSEDEDRALEPCVPQLTHADALRTPRRCTMQLTQSAEMLLIRQLGMPQRCKQRPCDAQQFEDWCWCPRSGTTRHQSIQDRFSQSSSCWREHQIRIQFHVLRPRAMGRELSVQ